MNRITAAVVLAALTTGSLAAGDTRQVVRMPEPMVRHLLDTVRQPWPRPDPAGAGARRHAARPTGSRSDWPWPSLDAHGASRTMPPCIACTEPPGRAQ